MNMKIGKSQLLYQKAKKIIPNGTQLLSKRPEMFLPEYWPSYYTKAKGCEVWDLDENKYIDMSYMSVGTNILGYADDDVDEAVIRTVKNGNMSTLNAPEEVWLAEKLIEMHPWAEMVRYTRSGGEAMAVAVRLARAKTNREKVLFCGYHGWHDWYLSANLINEDSLNGHLLPGLEPAGIPNSLTNTSFPFHYNNVEEFINLVNKHNSSIACVVLESVRNEYPEKQFLEIIRNKCNELGIVLIIDEISAGFRLNTGGAHLLFGVEPDIAVFAKAISNGYPMAAVIGKKDVMEFAEKSFISSTYWTDKIGPAASLVTIKKLTEKDVCNHLIEIGKEIQEGWKKAALQSEMDIEIGGIYPISHFSFNHPKNLLLKTLYTQFFLEKGFLATTAFYASFAHKKEHVEEYLYHAGEIFNKLRKIIDENEPEKHLAGPVCQSGFKRLT